jgi:hypothetical protein
VATKIAAFKFDQCGCLAVPPAPTASASVPQNNRIEVGWNDSATSSIVQYFIFRSVTPGGPYTQIATVSDFSPGVGNGPAYAYNDDTVSGGTRYYYVVKSSDGVACLSAASGEVNALATGLCLLAPTFAGVTTVANPGNATCTLSLAWSAGTATCSGPVTYNVYRGTTSGFTPSPANRIATGLAGTATIDAVGLATGTTYYYVVRAVDAGNAVEDGNTVEKSGAPTGPISTSSWTDTFEGALSGGGFDQAGWTKGILNGRGSTNWAWSTARLHDGTHSWFAADVSSTSEKALVSPAFGVGATTTLSFWHTYAFEFSSSTCWDGGTLEYTTNGGAAWTVVPAADFTAGAYTGTTSSSNPMGAKAAWCQGVLGALTQVTVNLGTDANLVNKTVQLRWHEGDDTSVSGGGWYVDTVTIGNAQIAGSCSTGTGCTAPGAPTLVAAAGDCALVSLSWLPGSGSTNAYNVARGTAPGGPYTKLSGMPIAGTTYNDTSAVPGTIYYYVVTGACDVSGLTESVTSNELSAAKQVNGASCNDGNACTQTDTCQSNACVGESPVVCAASDQCHEAGTCDTGTGACSNPDRADGSPCSDGDGCTVSDSCQAGACASGSPVVCTASDQCHDAGVCDSGSGLCGNPAKSDGSACTDGNTCTDGDTCQTGTCVAGTPVPGAGATESLAFTTVSDLNWAASIGATGYDVIRGTLSVLKGAGFATATDACLGNHVAGTFISDTHVPAEGDADWFLIRAYNFCGTGSYDDGSASEIASRDADIAASPNACP